MPRLATKWTPQVAAARIARRREEKYPAPPATGQLPAQFGLGPQYRSQKPVVRQHQRRRRPSPIPARLVLE